MTQSLPKMTANRACNGTELLADGQVKEDAAQLVAAQAGPLA